MNGANLQPYSEFKKSFIENVGKYRYLWIILLLNYLTKNLTKWNYLVPAHVLNTRNLEMAWW